MSRIARTAPRTFLIIGRKLGREEEKKKERLNSLSPLSLSVYFQNSFSLVLFSQNAISSRRGFSRTRTIRLFAIRASKFLSPRRRDDNSRTKKDRKDYSRALLRIARDTFFDRCPTAIAHV